MKKILSLILSLALVFTLCVTAFAAGGTTVTSLHFNSDGSFKIMQINDSQDIDRMNKKTVSFIKAALEAEKPDLVVFVGDQLSSTFPGATASRIKTAIRKTCGIVNDAKIPFAVTFGNHDHDLEKVVSTADMMDVYREFEYCVWNEGCDPGTYNIPVTSSDGNRIAMNIYMMDTNNKREDGGYAGLFPNQVEWYRQKSDELKAANGGKVVPSLLFQHIPVKEIYQFMTPVSAKKAGSAVFSTDDRTWYKLNNEKIISAEKMLGEAPCSEHQDVVTGQYEAWLEKGDIVGAFFGHDHVNNFVGKTDEGLILGYNGGAGFRSYGSGSKRSVRIFEIDENNVSDYTTRPVYYSDLCGEAGLLISDIIAPTIISDLLRYLLRILRIASWN